MGLAVSSLASTTAPALFTRPMNPSTPRPAVLPHRPQWTSANAETLRGLRPTARDLSPRQSITSDSLSSHQVPSVLLGALCFGAGVVVANAVARLASARSDRRTSMAAAPAQDSAVRVGELRPAAKVDLLLETIKDTDAGAAISAAARDLVEQAIESLEEGNTFASYRPLKDPRIYGNYRVAYVGTGPRQVGNPAGGRWRGAVGRTIFRTTGLYQNLLPDNVVVNLVKFRFLGFLNGAVVLNGTFVPTGKGDFVRATFQSPRLCFSVGDLKVAFDVGPRSAVELDCAYVDDRIRLGRGSRGSSFVFERTEAEEANSWKEVLAVKPTPTLVVPLILIAAFALSYVFLKSRTVVAVGSAIAFALYLLLVRRGGIVDEDDSARRALA
jgi:hypothetical protein